MPIVGHLVVSAPEEKGEMMAYDPVQKDDFNVIRCLCTGVVELREASLCPDDPGQREEGVFGP